MIEFDLYSGILIVIGTSVATMLTQSYWASSKPKRNTSDPDDRMVAAFLHAEGSSTVDQMSASCATPHRSDINQSLVRLCARGIVERQDDSTRHPVFKIAEGAEVLIDE